MSSYQGAAYAGWAGGPWYAIGTRRRELQRVRHLAPAHALRASGRRDLLALGPKLRGHAEAGYHWVLPAAGGMSASRPMRRSDYVNAHLQASARRGLRRALRERDGRELLPDDARRSPTTRIAMGDHGMLMPELRLGWSHEFLDASQTITRLARRRAGKLFSATGIAFGRDAALVGAGFSMELSPDAKVFVDYDGKLSSPLAGAFDLGRPAGEVLGRSLWMAWPTPQPGPASCPQLGAGTHAFPENGMRGRA